MNKTTVLILLTVLALAILVWAAGTIAIWHYKASCEPLGDQFGAQWLECPL